MLLFINCLFNNTASISYNNIKEETELSVVLFSKTGQVLQLKKDKMY